MTKGVVLHRGRTFEYQGETWCYTEQGPRGGTDFAYTVWRESDGAGVNEDFHSVAAIREYVDRCAANGWPLIDSDED